MNAQDGLPKYVDLVADLAREAIQRCHEHEAQPWPRWKQVEHEQWVARALPRLARALLDAEQRAEKLRHALEQSLSGKLTVVVPTGGE